MVNVLDNPWFDSKRLLPFVKRFGVDLVVVFGSQARGQEHEHSDLDVAVRINRRTRRAVGRGGMEHALWRCTIGQPWDVQMVLINTVEDPLILFEIAEDGVLVYERYEGQWILQRWKAAQVFRGEEVRRRRFSASLGRFIDRLGVS